MKIRWDVFNGIRPRQSRAKLPPGYGQVADNVRARSGDLESWASPALDQTLPKTGPIRSLFLMARQFWLHFAGDVDFARGPIPAESNDEERTYFTGTDCPRVTTRQLATEDGAGGGYPYRSLKLGMPAPDDPPEVVTNEFGGRTTIFEDSGSSLNGWLPSDGVSVDPEEGLPQPSFRLQTDFENDRTVVDISREISSFIGSYSFEISFDYRIETEGTHKRDVRIWIASDEDLSSDDQLLVLPGTFPGWVHAELSGRLVEVDEYEVSIYVTPENEPKQFIRTRNIKASGDWFRFQIIPSFREQGDFFIFEDTTAHFDNMTVDKGAARTDKLILSAYVVTFLSPLVEESAPSPVSDEVFVGEGVSNAVTIPDAGPADNSFLSIGWRLYRAATGATTTAFLLVNETRYADPDNPTSDELTYTDEKSDSQLGEVMESENWDLPPQDGHSILALPNGVMVMASKNEVVPSVRFRPHAYPVDFRLATDRNIVTLAALDTTVFALTESHTYQAIGDDPSALSMAKFGPPYACVSKRSVAYLSDIGFLYASPDGLVAGNTQRLWLISEPWITPREWKRDFFPETITAIAHNDIYFGFYDTGSEKRGFVFDPAQDGFGFAPLEIGVDGVHVDPLTDSLYFTQGQDLFLWEGDPQRLTYTWRSRKELLPHPNAFSIAQVDAESYDDLTMRLFADGAQYFEKAVTGPDEFRIAPADGRDIEIELTGTDVVHMAEVADDVEELT